MRKEVARKSGGYLMKPRGLLFIALAILVVTAFSAAIATAQNVGQQSASPSLAVPNNTGTFDTGTKQSSSFIPGESNTNSKQQTMDPQPKDRRDRRDRNNGGDAPSDQGTGGSNTPTPAAPSGGSGSSDSPSNTLKELPRTGGPGA
jgi:hypothetical protein